MWLCRRLGIVRVANAHKRGSRHGTIYNHFHLYHWGKPAMWSRPCDWRDDDPNAGLHDPTLERHPEVWEYVGNMFDLLPYSAIAGVELPAANYSEGK